MPTETGKALLVLVIFVLPGFVTLVIKERTHEIPAEVSPFERLFQAIYYSLLVYIPLAALGAVLGLDREEVVRLYEARDGLWALAGVAVVSGIVLPLAVAYVGHRWIPSTTRLKVLGFLRVPFAHRTFSAWDYFFGLGLPVLVRVTVSSGEMLGGYFGPLSFAGHGQQSRDLWLEEQWVVDPNTYLLTGPVENSLGLWIAGDEIVELELYAVDPQQIEDLRSLEEGAGDEQGETEGNPDG